MSEEIKKTEEVVEGNEIEGEEGEGTPVEVTTKKQTWLNRIYSAVVGAILAIGAMFGISQPQLNAQKAKVTEVKTKAATAIEALKCGDTQMALTLLQETIGNTKEITEQAKKDYETLKTKTINAKDAATKELKKGVTTSTTVPETKK